MPEGSLGSLFLDSQTGSRYGQGREGCHELISNGQQMHYTASDTGYWGVAACSGSLWRLAPHSAVPLVLAERADGLLTSTLSPKELLTD